jgi:hypothetical protein
MKPMNREAIAYPEIAVATRQDTKTFDALSGWKVEEGNAGVSFDARVLSTPTGDGNARVIRGREMVRANISLSNDADYETLCGQYSIGTNTLKAVEEYRLSLVAKHRGFDAFPIVTGYEKQAGEDLAKANTRKAHDQAILVGASLAGTKAFSKFASGVKAGGQAEWVKEMREVQAKMKRGMANTYAKYLSSNEPEEVAGIEVPSGVIQSVRLAHEVQKYLLGDPTPQKGDFYGKGGERYETANGAEAFAPLIFMSEEDLPLSIRSKGEIHAKKRAVNSGGAVRYPARLLTDNERRIFSTKKRAKGGIVVIDISGSMDLPSDDLDRILNHAPNATVFAYSHKPRDTTATPNAFMLVKGGKRVAPDRLPDLSNVGNGVDAPALDYALYIKKGNEPVIWVCDGQTTDANDRSYGADIVARMLWKNGIIQVPNTNGAIEALRNPAKAKVGKKYYGRVGREVEVIRKRGRR